MPNDVKKEEEAVAAARKKEQDERDKAAKDALAKRADEKKAAEENKAAVAGAEAVAKAVAKFAADAAAAAKGIPISIPDVFVEGGVPRFVLRPKAGVLFGTGGVVTVDGKPAHTTGWGATRIEGNIPEGVKEGEVVVHVDEATRYYGFVK
jgi:hypothetical protein